jgi:hypothetical protein
MIISNINLNIILKNLKNKNYKREKSKNEQKFVFDSTINSN